MHVRHVFLGDQRREPDLDLGAVRERIFEIRLVPLAQRGQRRLQLVRGVAQKAVLVGIGLDQATAQPVQLVGELFHGDREPVARKASEILERQSSLILLAC